MSRSLSSFISAEFPFGSISSMTGGACIDDPQRLAKFSVSTNSLQFPVAASPINPLYRLGNKSDSTEDSSQVLATVQGEGVQIYSTTDSRCLRSWTFPPSIRFTCPAKYYSNKDSNSFVYAALTSGEGIAANDEGTVVWRWTDRGMKSVGLEDKIVAKFNSPVLALEPGVSMAGDILVLHCNGFLTLASKDLVQVHGFNSPIPGQHSQHRLVWYQLVDVSQSMRTYLDSRQVADWLAGSFILAFTLVQVPEHDSEAENDNAFSYYLNLVAIDAAQSVIVEVGSTQISPAYLSTRPLGCAFDADTGVLAMLTETGSYMQLKLSANQSSALDDPIMLERAKEVVLRGFIPCVAHDKLDNQTTTATAAASNMNMQSQLSLVSLSEKYVAIVGTHNVVSHTVKGKYESILTVWDLQYGCLHAEKSLPVHSSLLSVSNKPKSTLPRLVYQVQPLSPRLDENGAAADQISLAIAVAHTAMPHSTFGAVTVNESESVPWEVEMFVASCFLPPVTLLASLKLQNNAKYYVDPEQQITATESSPSVHSSNALLREEQEQGLGVLRSGWEAIVDGTDDKFAGKTVNGSSMSLALKNIHKRRGITQSSENEVLLALSKVSDAISNDQYTQLFLDHIGIKLDPSASVPNDMPTWISSHLVTTTMRRCFAEPLGVSRSSHLSLFAPRVIEFILLNCGLCNAHTPEPGLLPHLLARVDCKKHTVLSDDPAWNLINQAMDKCPDLPEQHIVDVQNFQLSHYKEHLDGLFMSETTDSMGDTERRITADISRIVASMTNSNVNEDAMRLALSNIPLEYVICIIQRLVLWLRGWNSLGANVELSTSAKFAATFANNYSLAQKDKNTAKNAATIKNRAISEASGLATPSSLKGEGIPPVDESLTVFFLPTAAHANGGDNQPSAGGDMDVVEENFAPTAKKAASLVRTYTKKWAPKLEIPQELVGAPVLGKVVDLISLLLDAHMSNLLLSGTYEGLVGVLTQEVEHALITSERLKLLGVGLIPFHLMWKNQQEERAAKALAEQNKKLGLDEIVMRNGTTKAQAERRRENQPNAQCAQGTGEAGTYWERVQKLEKYRVEIMHW